jgi:hypothetical protein
MNTKAGAISWGGAVVERGHDQTRERPRSRRAQQRGQACAPRAGPDLWQVRRAVRSLVPTPLSWRGHQARTVLNSISSAAPSSRQNDPLPTHEFLFLRAVFLNVSFAGFLCMMPCVASMTVSHVRMMPCLFVSSTFMVLGGFTMVASRMLMMLSSGGMVLSAFMLASHVENLQTPISCMK